MIYCQLTSPLDKLNPSNGDGLLYLPVTCDLLSCYLLPVTCFKLINICISTPCPEIDSQSHHIILLSTQTELEKHAGGTFSMQSSQSNRLSSFSCTCAKSSVFHLLLDTTLDKREVQSATASETRSMFRGLYSIVTSDHIPTSTFTPAAISKPAFFPPRLAGRAYEVVHHRPDLPTVSSDPNAHYDSILVCRFIL